MDSPELGSDDLAVIRLWFGCDFAVINPLPQPNHSEITAKSQRNHSQITARS